MFLVKKPLQKDFFVSIYFQKNNFFDTHKEQDLVNIFTLLKIKPWTIVN